MSDLPLTHENAEARVRALLAERDLPEPDAIEPRHDGGIRCFWHEQRVMLLVTADDAYADDDPTAPREASPEQLCYFLTHNGDGGSA